MKKESWGALIGCLILWASTAISFYRTGRDDGYDKGYKEGYKDGHEHRQDWYMTGYKDGTTDERRLHKSLHPDDFELAEDFSEE